MSATAQTAREMLLWLGDNNADMDSRVVTARFLGEEFAGEPQLDDQQRRLLSRVCGRLRSAGLIDGIDVDEEYYPILVWLTPDGHRCVEDFDGDVRKWEERNVSKVDKSISVNTGGGASQLAAHVGGDVTQNQTVGGIDVEKLVKAAEIAQASLPALALPEEEEQQARQAVEEILAEAEQEQPDQGLMAKAGAVLRRAMAAAQSGAALLPVIMDALSAAGVGA
ncbi:hypothetical protein ADK67_04805 [Saccharothrix sp. NRRL B-16348]|uniref:hypothetical protein n=1 Tax=Saccharothrix sp. NRRL B-16348 TaxID=1415542 RepID=UPI0006AE9DA2|nr:hypothetical protein [Saccharothrix sp. NRRL B-16348]KOX33972.1 hypothetical protein ADK67_04805 [Saccharothrix sp. NRRL B-16348]